MARKKIIASTNNNGWVTPKSRKRRKPMTAAQRVAAAERLEKARASWRSWWQTLTSQTLLEKETL